MENNKCVVSLEQEGNFTNLKRRNSGKYLHFRRPDKEVTTINLISYQRANKTTSKPFKKQEEAHTALLPS